jgi:hypothetical protein
MGSIEVRTLACRLRGKRTNTDDITLLNGWPIGVGRPARALPGGALYRFVLSTVGVNEKKFVMIQAVRERD